MWCVTVSRSSFTPVAIGSPQRIVAVGSSADFSPKRSLICIDARRQSMKRCGTPQTTHLVLGETASGGQTAADEAEMKQEGKGEGG